MNIDAYTTPPAKPTPLWPFPTSPIYLDNVPPPIGETPNKKISKEPFTVSRQSDKVVTHRREK